MYQIKTKNIACPNCNRLISPEERLCPYCHADLAIAAVIAERVMSTAPLFPAQQPATPEMLAPRIGEYLVEQGDITPGSWSVLYIFRKRWLIPVNKCW